MTSSTQRSIEIDFFRGLALVVIMLDHIPNSLLSHITLHHYAFCDAAEVFVFVGGYSTAAAYGAICARQGEAAAAARFLRRGGEIYRAFLLSAALMIGLGLALHGLGVDTPDVDATEAATFLRRPFGMLADIVSLRRQPFLSSVLPMYAMFALAAPLLIGCARRTPWFAVVASLCVWYAAPALAQGLPSAYPEGWAFNPFAWQLLFVLGAVARIRPLDPAYLRSPDALTPTRIACGVALACAFWCVFLTVGPAPGYEKQNLGVLRLLNFGVLAWLAAWVGARGAILPLARALPALVRIGRRSLPCFVGGAGISLTLDALLRPMFLTGLPLPHAFEPLPSWLIGGIDDFCAIVLLIGVERLASADLFRHPPRRQPFTR
ncbi:OpgC domain-containing protein [Robbsia sp. Bb-Pol-6]|uniref:OpgC domain-containing protein n=1 Tax=Robbsia betulipollinis TaxID=2981849 RepID=A0ABT3ZMF4_9BURK|nr:OpgC domain-containing protein [Robbsia betulipollinis]MCY0387497.1 OpgC domain-containing protein [Robbsia betulipollinis]